MSMAERADYAVRGNSSCHERIFVNVNVIVEVDEIVSQRLTEYGRGDCHQRNGDEEVGDP